MDCSVRPAAACPLAAASVDGRLLAPCARHVAICTVHHVDHLVSWNFKHLVNVRRAAGFNAVNLLQGYARASIVNPKELIYANWPDEEL